MRSQHRIDRHEDAAGGGGAEQRHDRLDSLVQVDGYPLAAPEAQPPQPGTEPEQLLRELGVAHRGILEGEGRCLAAVAGARDDQVVQLRWRGHHETHTSSL